MLQVYGVDVLDPAVSTRRVWVLAERMPPWALRFGEAWSTEAELLAVLVDHVANLTWVTLRAAGAKRAPRPAPLPRPQYAQARAQPEPGQAAGASSGPPGGTKADSWAQAAQLLAGMPGMKVSRDG